MPDIAQPASSASRNCLREPIPEIFKAAELFDLAVTAHIADGKLTAAKLIRRADMPAIREWIVSLWGIKANNCLQSFYHRIKLLKSELHKIPKTNRQSVRLPDMSGLKHIICVYGWNCACCRISPMEAKARTVVQTFYPVDLSWRRHDVDCHAAFQCMTPGFEYTVPHCYGGSTDIDNTTIACGPCNCGKSDRLNITD